MPRPPDGKRGTSGHSGAEESGEVRALRAELAEVRGKLREAHETIRSGLVPTDLTAQHAAEARAAAACEALKEQHAFLERAQETVGLGWWRSDLRPPARMTASPGLLAIFGLTAEQFGGDSATFWARIHPEDRPRIAAKALDAVADADAIFQDEYRVLRPDGSIRWVVESAIVERDETGTAIRVLGIGQDITDRKQIEDEARASERRLRTLFDNAPVGIYDLSASGEIVRANPCFCEITGFASDELTGRPMRDLLHPDDHEAVFANVARIRSGEIDSYSMEQRYRLKDGGFVRAEVNRAVVRDTDGAPLLFIGVVRDITAQRDAEDKIRALNTELEARVQQRTAELVRANGNLEAFSYCVAHDLRAPLRAMTGYSEALLEECGELLDETGRGYTATIQTASERMALLIDDLLLLSRVSRAEITTTTMDLSAEATAIAAELQSGEPGRRVCFLIQPGVLATGDRALIRTVLQNLLENAWKFTAKRDNATIEFGAAAAESGKIRCHVRDNGAGFDPHHANVLFQPFQRLHAEDDFPGTGIGLASVRQVIERHGGEVWAEGTPGQGATFYLTLDRPA